MTAGYPIREITIAYPEIPSEFSEFSELAKVLVAERVRLKLNLEMPELEGDASEIEVLGEKLAENVRDCIESLLMGADIPPMLRLNLQEWSSEQDLRFHIPKQKFVSDQVGHPDMNKIETFSSNEHYILHLLALVKDTNLRSSYCFEHFVLKGLMPMELEEVEAINKERNLFTKKVAEALGLTPERFKELEEWADYNQEDIKILFLK